LAFEVGDDVLAAFSLSDADEAVQSVLHVPGKYNLNLTTVAQRQLLACGVDAGHISGGDLCTFSDAQRFYSFRRDGQTGRMATLILVR
jgi:copper oxidase (laccase) domain-containing protein